MQWALLNTRNTKVAILRDCIHLQEDNTVEEAILKNCEINLLFDQATKSERKDFFFKDGKQMEGNKTLFDAANTGV